MEDHIGFIPDLIFVLLGQTPSLHPLQSLDELPKVRPQVRVRRLHRYYGLVRLLRFVHRRVAPFGFTARTCAMVESTPMTPVEPEISRLPLRRMIPSQKRLRLFREMLRCVHGVSDSAG